MKNKRNWAIVICIIFQSLTNFTFGQEKISIDNFNMHFVQNKDWTKLYRIPKHPAFDSLLTAEKEEEILIEINRRRRELKSDTLLTADYFYVWKPYFDWLRNEDPHYRIKPSIIANNQEELDYMNERFKQMTQLALINYNINDTIIVYKPYDSKFKRGDMLLSINDISMSEYLKYYYSDRYSSPGILMANYYFSYLTNNFRVRVIRDGKELDIISSGSSDSEIFKHAKVEGYDVKIYEDAMCGYVRIRQFYQNNSRLIKIVNSAIKDFKKKGITNVIIDVRENPGGNGHNFDKLLSIFINKPTIEYLKGQKLRVSEETLGDYDFLTKDMIGKNVDIPDNEIVKDVELMPKMFIEGMSYYLLVSEATGSMAATFVNILQYNNAATIVGEPLLRNALKYGEVLSGGKIPNTLLNQISISSMEIDEHTKAIDGVLMPDIHIPYVAREYMTGKDAVLEKLLIIITNSSIPKSM